MTTKKTAKKSNHKKTPAHTAAAAKGRASAKHYQPDEIAAFLVKFAELRASGNTADAAAKAIGLHPSRLYYWQAQAAGKPWGGAARRDVVARKTRTAIILPGTTVKRTDAGLQQQVRDLRADVALWKRVATAAMEGRL